MSWLKIRADEEDLTRWKLAATADGVDFSKWVRGVLNGAGVAEVATDLGSQKISTPGVEVEKRSVARRTGTIRKIEDVTHAVARKHLPEVAGTRSPGSKDDGRCTYQPMGDRKCPQCGKVHSHV